MLGPSGCAETTALGRFVPPERVALGRAFAPALVLLDEPFSNLDAALRVRMRAEVCTVLTTAGASAWRVHQPWVLPTPGAPPLPGR